MLVSDLRIMCNIHAYFDFYRTVNSLDMQLYFSFTKESGVGSGDLVRDVAMRIE